MSPTIIAIIIAAATLILSIFAAGWLNQQSVNRQLDQFEKRFNERLAAFEQTISARFETIGVRLTTIETRLDKIERQLDAIFKPVLPGGER